MRVRHWPALSLAVWLIAPAAAVQADLQEQRLVQIQHRIETGDIRTAKVELEQVISQAPEDPRSFNLLGVIEAQENNFAAAESDFRHAIQLAASFTGAYLNLGRLYQEHPDEPGTLEKALAVYRKLLALEPGQVEANYQAAWLLNRLGQFAASLEHLRRLPSEAQQRSQALALRCADSTVLGQTAQAEAACKQLLASPDLAEIDILSILPVLLKHHAEDLATGFLKGLEHRGLASATTLHQLGGLQEQRGEFKEARDTLERELKLVQPSAALLAQLARVAYRGQDLEGALGYLAHARDLEPGNPAVHFFFGMICVELKLPPEAKASLKESVHLDPDNPYYNYALGAVLINEKNAEAAIPHFKKYRAGKPDDARGRFALGVAYYDAYQLDSARKEFLAIANRAETRWGAQLYLGRLAIREENLNEASYRFQQAIQANPTEPEAYAESGLVHIRRNEYSLAEKDLTRALTLAPDHYLSNLRLLMLYQRTKDSRADAQAKRVEELRKFGEEKERLLLRSLDIRPY